MDRYIRISKVNKMPGFPLRAATLYKWRTLRKFPQIFATFGGAVFVNLAEVEKIMKGSGGR
jgi:hypothetical protein